MAQDPSLGPPVADGPFSRYLQGQEVEIQPQLMQQQRPSGYMGTGGKLAYLGASLLQGLQKGKVATYARAEQGSADQFAQDAKYAHDFLANHPDLDPNARTQIEGYLTQEWQRKVKKSVKETQGNHEKGSPLHKLHEMLSTVADKLGGPTPQGHDTSGTVPGSKDPVTGKERSARDMMYELMGKAGNGGPQYSLTDRAKSGADLFDQIRAEGQKAGKSFNSEADVFDFDPKRAVRARELLGASPKMYDEYRKTFRNLTPAEEAKRQDNEHEAKIRANQPQVVSRPVETGSPRIDQPIVTGGDKPPNTPVVSGAPEVPVSSPKQAPEYPFQFPDGTVVNNAEDEAFWAGKKGGGVYHEELKRQATGPDGKPILNEDGSPKMDHVTVRMYDNLPGYAKSVSGVGVGKRIDTTGWIKEGDKDPGPKLEKWTHYDAKTGKEVTEWVEAKLGIKHEGDVKPLKGVSPEVGVERALRVRELQLLVGEKEKKDAIPAAVSKIMSDIDKDARDPNKTITEQVPIDPKNPQKGTKDVTRQMTRAELLDERINDFGAYYKGVPYIDENYDAVQEALKKRKGELTSLDKKEADVKKAQAAVVKARGDLERRGLVPKEATQTAATGNPKVAKPKAQTKPVEPQSALKPGEVAVTDPQGNTHVFPNKAVADQFKQLTGIK